ncbi:MAG: hypothetical protein ACRDH8_11265 [Actinomycetota bacterium]
MAQMTAFVERTGSIEGGEGRNGPGSRVIAVVLSDGTVREVGPQWADRRSISRSWSSGSVGGDDWMLWWERRSYR